MLYIGTASRLPLTSSPELRIEAVKDARGAVRQWFSQPEVRFVGAHTGCSCGFPSFIADSPVEYYAEMPLDSDDRLADLRSVRALVALLDQIIIRDDSVELYPVADGDEAKIPKGLVEWQLDTLDPERFFFTEGFKHVVRRKAAV